MTRPLPNFALPAVTPSELPLAAGRSGRPHRAVGILWCFIIGLLLAACGQTAVSDACPPAQTPPFAQTAQVLATCLPPDATPDEAAEMAVHYLRQWQRLGERHWGGTWGDALAVPMLPGGEMALVRASYSAYAPEAITRTYRLNGEGFELVAQSINPEAAVLSATTPDGSEWYSFDLEYTRARPSYGLYQVQNGRLTHYEFPQHTIISLKTLADGRLYVGGWQAVFRVEDGRFFNLLETAEFAPLAIESFWAAHDMALAANGDLWIAGRMQLLRLGREQSETYPYLANGVMVAPDQTVWVRAWDGQIDRNCCYLHIVGDEVTPYPFDAPLPALESKEWEQ